MSEQGGVSVAITTKGMLEMLNTATPLLMNQLKSMNIPDPSKISSTIPNVVSSTRVKISISGGKFNPTELTMKSISQKSGGQFSIRAILVGEVTFDSWHEKKTKITVGIPSKTKKFTSSDFRIMFQSIELTINITLSLDSSNNLSPNITNISIDKNRFTYHVPKKSGLTSSDIKCVKKKINSEMKKEIKSTTSHGIQSFQSGMQGTLSTLPNSGKLSKDIQFLFPGTPNGLQFPDDNGVQYRVLGQMMYKGTPASGDIGTVPFPPLPTDGRDATFFVSSYEFSALFWAMFKDGLLKFSFNCDNIESDEEEELTTNYYKNSSLQALQTKYPSRNMIVDLEIQSTPMVSIAKANATVFYEAHLTFWVAKAGKKTEKDTKVFVIDIKVVDALEDFTITAKDNLQLLTFKISTIQQFTASVVESNIGKDVDLDIIEDIWQLALQPVYADVINGAADNGIPLPSAMNGLFKNHKIKLRDGYAAVSVDFMTNTASK